MSAGEHLGEPRVFAGASRAAVSPLRALAATTTAIFVADVVAMSLIAFVEPQTFVVTTLLDGLGMLLFAFPILYVLVFRPMMRLLEAHDRIQEGLEVTNTQLRTQVVERERAQEALQRYATKQATLYAVTAAATHRLDLDARTAEVTDVVLKLFGADAGWVLVPGEAPADPPRVSAISGAAEVLAEAETSEPLERCDRCGPWFADGLPSRESPIVTDCPRLPPDLLASAGFSSHVGVLLRAGTRVLGSLNLAWREPHAHSEAERSLLVTIAGQVGLALENGLLYSAEKRALQTADTMRAASLAITRSLDLKDVLTSLLDHLQQLVTFDRAKVMLLDAPTKLAVRAIFADGAITFPGERDILFGIDADPVISTVLSTGRGFLVPDIHRHPEWSRRAQPACEHSWMGVPLISGDTIIGLYSLAKAEPDSFTTEDLRLAEALSAPASVSIDNAGLFREVLASRERQKTLSRRLVELQEEERLRVSRELHDEAGQSLTSLLFNLHLLKREAEPSSALIARAEDLERMAEGVQETLHRVATGLRPVALDHLGLVPALTQLVEELSNRRGPNVVLETIGTGGDRLPSEIETALYRVAQEAVTNAMRHAAAKEIAIVLERRGDRFRLLVEDDGRGIDAGRAERRGRLGMMGMRERVEMLGGTFAVESGPGEGTTILVEVPNGR